MLTGVCPLPGVSKHVCVKQPRRPLRVSVKQADVLRLSAPSTSCRCQAWTGLRAKVQRRSLHCHAQASDTDSSTDKRIKQTLADLDAILGISEENDQQSKGVTATIEPKRAETPDEDLGLRIAVSPEVLRQTAREEAQRIAGSDAKKSEELETVLDEQLRKIVDKAKKIADEEDKMKGDAEASLQKEYLSLLNIVLGQSSGPTKEEIKTMKEQVFGPLTFWVTETRQLEDFTGGSGGSGIIVRGNLRDERTKVFDQVRGQIQQLFGGKYEVLLIEDPDEDAVEAASGAPRVAFQIVPAAAAQPPPTTGWQMVVSAVLIFLLLASCVQLALVANITKLPKETLLWFADPKNLDSGAPPPGLDTWNPVPYLLSVVPMFFSSLGINVTHEVGHRIAAAVRGVRLGPAFFIPNLQIGSFGAITPIKSLVRNRADLWDVAAAGPLAGISVSFALLAVGLLASRDSSLPPELLVPVPTQLFQGSLLLGSIVKLSLGDEALRSSQVLISPFTIAGWCGLVTNALNLLPVGQLDGGRMMQASFGKQSLSLSSFFTYVGLGLGFLGSSLSLPFGLYVLICQRGEEKYIQDNVSPAGDTRQIVTVVAITFAVLTLIPMAPELAESVGLSPTDLL